MTEPAHKNGYNILVVDDNPMNIRLLISMLEDEGYRIWPALNGNRALSALEKHAIDLILLDIRMPEMDGYEVCRRVRSNEKTREIPVIFVSALGETFDKLQAFSVGGVDYVTKPFEEKEVLARIRTQLKLVEQQRRWQALAEVTCEGILVCCHGKVVDVNPALEAMLGYKRGDLSGITVFDLLTPGSAETARNHLNNGSEDPVALRGIKKDGSDIPLDIKIRPVIWQGYDAHVFVIRDMSWRTFFRQEQKTFEAVLADGSQFGELVGKSDVMKKVFKSILRAAASDAPVLISGETGTGKELTARTLFNLSDTYTRAFIPVNCASIPDQLFESLFFGHKKGAFTGADTDHAGFFEQATGGVLFLDEVGELSLDMQAKLLRVLNDFIYTPVGSNTLKKADVRIVAATNRNLTALVDQKRIRPDFFHRLYVLNIDLPPLRWRKEDIPDLITHFFIRNPLRDRHPLPENRPPRLPGEIMDRFNHYDWPGNVRELFNELHRYTATGEVYLSRLLPRQTTDGSPDGLPMDGNMPLCRAVEEFERVYIPRVLKANNGHRGKTADTLDIDRKTLYRKLKKYGLI